MNYDIVTLGDVCEFLDSQRVPITESDRKPGPYPYYGANGQQDSIDSYIFDEPLVLLAEDGGYFGSKDRPIAYKVTGKCWVNNHAHVLRPKPIIDIDYLHRVLSYYDVTKYVNGTTRQKLTKANAENISFPLPPLSEQKRIASLLARADRLRSLRRHARHLADSLLQSVFLEMFGEPKTNPKGWDVDDFEKAIISTQNGFGQREDYSPKGIIVLRIRDISSGKIDYSDPRRMIIPEKELAKYTLDHEDLILVRVNGNPNYVGIASEFTVQNEPIVFSDHVIRVKMNRKLLNTTFTVHLLNSPYGRKQTLGNITTTAGQFTINSSGLSRLKLIYPPLPLQEEFARVAARVEGLRARQAEAERQAEGLFQSLLSESFG